MRITNYDMAATISSKAEEKIQSFTDLRVWREGHSLVMMIYRITKKFPKDELFGLKSQMRRSAVSITSNIAEGFSKRSYKEKTQFYIISLGSLTELQNQLLIAKDIEYITRAEFDTIALQTVIVSKMLSGLIKKTRETQRNS